MRELNTPAAMNYPSGNGPGIASPFAPSAWKLSHSPGDVKRLVFLVDNSGSMIDVMPLTMSRLKSSILKLSSSQEFAVIFCGRTVATPGESGLLRANPDNKRFVLALLDEAGNVVPAGAWNLATAIELASKRKPQLIVITSDESEPSGPNEVDQRELARALDSAKANGIYFIVNVLLHRDARGTGRTAGDGDRSLEYVAKRTGGQYNSVTIDQP
jgi:hypothetical protein